MIINSCSLFLVAMSFDILFYLFDLLLDSNFEFVLHLQRILFQNH